MSRNLENEYREMMHQDLPDLWARIEAALPEKVSAAEESFTIDNTVSSTENIETKETKVTENNVIVNDVAGNETTAQDSTNNAGLGGKKSVAEKIAAFPRRKFYKYTGIAAACIVGALVIPVVLLNNSALSDNSAIETETVAGSASEDYYEAEDSCQSVDSWDDYDGYAEESAPAEAPDSMEDVVTNDTTERESVQTESAEPEEEVTESEGTGAAGVSEDIYGQAYTGELLITEVLYDANGEFFGYLAEVVELEEANEIDYDYSADVFISESIYIHDYDTYSEHMSQMPEFDEYLFAPGDVIDAEIIYIGICQVEPAENYHFFGIFSFR